MSELIILFGTFQMKIIVGLVVIDVILGILSAIFRKEFSFRKLGNFMRGPVLGYVFGFAVIELVGQALSSFAILIQAVFYIIVVALAVSILRNLNRIGLPLPGVLTK